jgi:hypothetical protein
MIDHKTRHRAAGGAGGHDVVLQPMTA